MIAFSRVLCMQRGNLQRGRNRRECVVHNNPLHPKEGPIKEASRIDA
jgi:hypothetical protein